MKVALVAVLALGMVGCVELMPENQRKIDDLQAANQALLDEMESLVQKGKDGTITLSEAYTGVKAIQGLIDRNRKEIEEIKKAEGLSWRDGLLVTAGLVGRSILHGAQAVLPPQFAWIAGLLNLLLGGSESKKKALSAVALSTSNPPNKA